MNRRGNGRRLRRASFPGSVIPDRRSGQNLTTVDANERFHGYSFICCRMVTLVVNATTTGDAGHAVPWIQSGLVAGVARNYLPG